MKRFSKRWPSNFLWVKILLKTAPQHPIRVMKLFFKLLLKEISVQNFSLHAFGPTMVKDVVKCAEIANIKPFLFFGTLRGFVLLQDILPFSGDIDFALF